jgi:CheY-like chemotaxis protein
LVEDNEINQLVATTFLEGFGCNIKIANNGQEAVDMIKNQAENFDIIFMDIQMPIMNGYEATKIIKTELNPNIPIIAMTANAMKDDIKRCLDAGMNKHIGKPVDKNEIEKAILTFVKR